MRVSDGIICSTDVPRAPLPQRSTRARGPAATASTSSATRGRSPPRDGRDDRLGRRRRPQGVARALGAGDPRRACARGPRRASCPSATAPPTRSSRSSAPSARSPCRRRKIEVYPASMTLFDIAIAPSAENNLFRGKSDLRWLEASALGIPLVAHPEVYPEIEDGVTGVHARTPGEVEAALLRAGRRRRSCASASAPGPRRTSPSTGASRSPPSAGATCCSKCAPRRRRRKTSYRSPEAADYPG